MLPPSAKWTRFFILSTHVTSASSTSAFSCLRRIARIGAAIWLGASAAVATPVCTAARM